MRETTSSLTRAAVLVLVTCSFAAAWSNDRQTQTTFALARKEDWQRRTQLAVTAGSHVECSRSAGSGDACSGSESESVCAAAAKSTAARSAGRITVEMELPADIAPGRYHVVDSVGRTVTIVVRMPSERGASSAAKSVSVGIIADGETSRLTPR